MNECFFCQRLIFWQTTTPFFFKPLKNQKWASISPPKDSKYLTSFYKQGLNLYIYSLLYSYDFVSGVSKNFANNWRTKSPRPSRIPLPIPVGESNSGMNYVL